MPFASGEEAAVLSAWSANRPPVLEVPEPLRLGDRRRDAATHRPAEQPERAVDPGQPVGGDLLLLKDDAGERGFVEQAAAEQEPHPSRPAGSRTQEIHADQ